MTITPNDLLALAQSINLQTEVDIRNAAGRAYYAAYHMARNFHGELAKPGQAAARGGDHEDLIHRLQNPDRSLTANKATKSRAIGTLLRQIKPCRHKADYDIGQDMAAYEAALAIQTAVEIQSTV